MKVKALVVFTLLAAVMQSSEAKIRVQPGFTRNLLDVIGNWLGIAQVNLQDWYEYSHQCNWPLINKIVLNCPRRDPDPEEVTYVDPSSNDKAETALDLFSSILWSRDDIALKSFEERASFLKPCFDNEHNFLLCTQKAWTVLGMDMCQIWYHINDWNAFCGGEDANPCYCMNHQCLSERLERYNTEVKEEYKIDQYSRLPGFDWEPVSIDPVQKDWCDQH
ncbi:hypothetical protein EC973_006232, partial [Apophysomyces ossiformis]